MELRNPSSSPGSRIIFWQNIPSIHQGAVIREIARRTAVPILVVAENDVSEERREQGWPTPDFGSARVIIRPSRGERRRILSEAGNDSIHVFTGIHAYPETYWTFRQAVGGRATVGVYAEPVDDRGWRGILKRGLYRTQAFRWGARLDFMLVTGDRGRHWFSERGFRRERIFPYGYFVTSPDVDSIRGVQDGNPATARFEWLFVGQLLPHKGLDVLLNSLTNLVEEPWRLRVVGVGRDEATYRQLANRLGLADRVDWAGTVPNDEVQGLMASADAMVLPSRFDGWGAVVNEALSVGTPVLVSDACGAAELVGTSGRGKVFQADSVGSLTAALKNQIAKGKVRPDQRSQIQQWAASNIVPGVAADYLLSVMRYSRHGGTKPLAPWLRSTPAG